MFIGLGTSTAGIQKTAGGGPTSNPNVVGTSNDGNYPTGIESGDLVIVFATNNIPFSMPEGFTSLTSGNNGGNYYNIASLTAAGTESGLIGITALSIGCLVTRNQASSTIVTMVNNGSSWAMLTGLNTNSMIVAAGYSSDGSGNHGGETIPEGFTTFESSGTVILAVKDEPEAGTGFSYDGFVNSGSVAMCYSIGIG